MTQEAGPNPQIPLPPHNPIQQPPSPVALISTGHCIPRSTSPPIQPPGCRVSACVHDKCVCAIRAHRHIDRCTCLDLDLRHTVCVCVRVCIHIQEYVHYHSIAGVHGPWPWPASRRLITKRPPPLSVTHPPPPPSPSIIITSNSIIIPHQRVAACLPSSRHIVLTPSRTDSQTRLEAYRLQQRSTWQPWHLLFAISLRPPLAETT